MLTQLEVAHVSHPYGMAVDRNTTEGSFAAKCFGGLLERNPRGARMEASCACSPGCTISLPVIRILGAETRWDAAILQPLHKQHTSVSPGEPGAAPIRAAGPLE